MKKISTKIFVITAIAAVLGVSSSIATLFFAGVRVAPSILAAMIAATAIVAGIAALLTNRLISKRIARLSETIKKAADEDTGVNLRDDSDDEIGQLADAFRILLDKDQDFHAVLKQQVRKQTEELDSKIKEADEQNAKLDRTKKAILNVLDDTRELELAAKADRDRVRAIVNSMADGLFVLDKNFKIAMINPTAEKLFEARSEEALGKKLNEIISVYKKATPLGVEEWPAAKAITSGQTQSYGIEDDLYYKTRSGKMFPATIAATPLKGDRGISGAVVVFMDATSEKALDSAKTNFISVASHQLRTPLTSMSWFTEMMLDGDAGEMSKEQEHFLRRIYEGVQRMINLVNLLLQIARVEAGRVIVDPKPMSLKAITEQVADSLKPILKAKGQEVNIICNPDPSPEIPLDKEIVWQVIQNLISNANRYSFPKTPITIKIEQKGEFLEYSITNEGIGVRESDKARMFEKFFRTESAVKMVPEGSGLGLPLVKSLATGWGGKVWFESTENKETTFSFTIPAKGMAARAGEVKLTI